MPGTSADQKLRRARQWRQIDLAEQSGVHEVHISDMERGTREPGLRTLSKIASALETTLSELLKGLFSQYYRSAEQLHSYLTSHKTSL